MTPPPTAGPASRPVPAFIHVLMLAEMTCLGLLLPVLPGRIASFVGSGSATILGYGVATFLFAACFALGTGIAGSYSDGYGRRHPMLWNCFGAALGHLTAAISPGIALFLVCRAWGGLFNSNIALAQAYVADFSLPEERPRRFGTLGAMQGFGFVLGPILGGYLGAEDLRVPFVAAGIIAALTGVLGVFLLPESLPEDRRRATGVRIPHPLRPLIELRALPGFGPLVPGLAAFMLAQNILFTTWVPYATARFGWGPRENGLGMFTFGITNVLAQGLLFPFLSRRLSLPLLCLATQLSAVMTFAGLGIVRGGDSALVIMVTGMVGFGAFLAFQTLASHQTDPAHQGSVMGGLQALNTLNLLVAPLFTSLLLYPMSRWPASDWKAGLPMYFCSALALVATGASIRPLFRKS
ncbi:MAG: TCR/Tet family MFS transporter [Verrucomicrobia bacterium]|nr:TCR/Tet family MFS transporter [Verrucomicrobiota bacterium]